MPYPSPRLPLAYRGRRTAAGAVVEAQAPGGAWYVLDPRFDLRNHSPNGFEWGYAGSGPAQLALALAATRLPEPEGLAVYQSVKRALVLHFGLDQWQLEGARLDELLAELRAEDAAGAAEDLAAGAGDEPT